MEDVLRQFSAFRALPAGEIALSVLDVLLVTYIIYRLLVLVRGTRAWRILLGILAFLIVMYLSAQFKLHTLHWLMDKATILGPVALVILFLPELRQAIEGIGKITPLQILSQSQNEERAQARTVEEICAAVAELQEESVGALIVIEKSAKLDDIVANGVALNAQISASLIGAIFYGENPLHDGATIIRGDTILAAACRLPLSESSRIDPHVHMRHRAAVGVSEVADCLAVVVSEERGTISVAIDGSLRRLASPGELRDLLNQEIRAMHAATPHRRTRTPRKEGSISK